jgi:hypothetical protein
MTDLINGAFELVGAVLVWFNVRQLRRDKRVQGVSLSVQGFICTWGFWNLYYYPSLGHWLSFGGGVVLVIGNSVWLGMAVHYTRKRS